MNLTRAPSPIFPALIAAILAVPRLLRLRGRPA